MAKSRSTSSSSSSASGSTSQSSSSSGSDSVSGGSSSSSSSSSSSDSERSRSPRGRQAPEPRHKSPPRQSGRPARRSPEQRRRRSPIQPPRRDEGDRRNEGTRGRSRVNGEGRSRHQSPGSERGSSRKRRRGGGRSREPLKRRSSPDGRPGAEGDRSKRYRRTPERPRSREGRAERPNLPGPPPRRDMDGPSRGQRGGFSGGGGQAPDREVGKWRSKDNGQQFQQGKEVWGTEGNRAPDKKKEEVVVEPDFGLSGVLAAETNTVAGVPGVVLVYNEPPEAAKATLRWRLYTFKNGEQIGNPLQIHRQTHYLFGREPRIADIAVAHPSCSKQHAVLQYRRMSKEAPDGMPMEAVTPYLMDLGSTNGTYINNERLEPQRYYELLEQDMLKFGNSTREYVLLHEGSAGA